MATETDPPDTSTPGTRDWCDPDPADVVTWRLVLAGGEVVSVRAMPWLMEGYSRAEATHGGRAFSAECRYDDSIEDLGEVVGHLVAAMLCAQRQVRELVPPGGLTAAEREAATLTRAAAACVAVSDARYHHEPTCICSFIARGQCSDCDDALACAAAVRGLGPAAGAVMEEPTHDATCDRCGLLMERAGRCVDCVRDYGEAPRGDE